MSSGNECPLCFDRFPAAALERHASTCTGKKATHKGDTDSVDDDGDRPRPSPSPSPSGSSVMGMGVPNRTWTSSVSSSPWSGFKRKRERAGDSDDQQTDSGKRGKGDPSTVRKSPSVPLAELMRPRSLDDYLGQESVVGAGSMWRKLIERDHVPSIILWGPPGCGKTSLANVIAQRCKADKVYYILKLQCGIIVET